jgi:hypothetical protein
MGIATEIFDKAAKETAEKGAKETVEKGAKETVEKASRDIAEKSTLSDASKKALEDLGNKSPSKLKTATDFVRKNPKLVKYGLSGAALAGYMAVNGYSNPGAAAADILGNTIQAFFQELFGDSWKKILYGIVAVLVILIIIIIITKV